MDPSLHGFDGAREVFDQLEGSINTSGRDIDAGAAGSSGSRTLPTPVIADGEQRFAIGFDRVRYAAAVFCRKSRRLML